MLVRQKFSTDPEVRELTIPFLCPGPVMRRRIGSRLQRLQHAQDSGLRSLNCVPSRLSRTLNGSDADLIQLHWIGLETMSIADMAALKKPVVWTLHDMWPFSGAEHYVSEESFRRVKEGYQPNNRPNGAAGLDLDRWTWRRKRARWRAVQLISPSRWLASCARASVLTASWPIDVVPNPIDIALYSPGDKVEARRELGLPPAGRIVLFGAFGGAADPRKGFAMLAEAMERVSAPAHDGLLLCVFGGGQLNAASFLRHGLRQFGQIDDEARLISLYRAADVFVAPSTIDNFPNTVVEALACGTPVVGFEVGGIPDIVEHKRQGYLAQPFQATDLANGISWVLYETDGAALAQAARQRAILICDPLTIARKYEAIYRRVLGNG
jgi:glycosyltransferase involved in cell wall biosynthesis